MDKLLDKEFEELWAYHQHTALTRMSGDDFYDLDECDKGQYRSFFNAGAKIASPAPSTTGNGAVDENECYGPYLVDFLGPAVWAAIRDELPGHLAGKQVWVVTKPLAAPSLGIDAPEQQPVDGPWKKYARHLEWCATCSEDGPRSCHEGNELNKAAYAAHPAAQQAAADQWRPIETAPKDGREIILRRGERVGAASWVEWPGTEHEEAGAGWTICWDGDSWDGDKSPTHWQPLPAGPGETAAQQGDGDADPKEP